MGIHTTRNKPRNLLVTIIYRLKQILPMSNAAKFKLFLNLEWIFDKLSHEMSFHHYSAENHPVRQRSKKFILNHVKGSDTILDLGCDKGDISFIISDKAKEVIGIDYNQKAINIAKSKYKRDNLDFLHAEALDYLNENSKHFDVLILSHILEHLDDPKSFLMTFKKFFKYIYIEVPDFDKYYLNHYRKDLNLDLVYIDNDHIWEFDRDELHELLDGCNIEVVSEEFKYGVQKLWCKIL